MLRIGLSHLVWLKVNLKKMRPVSEKEFGILIELFQQERAFKYDFTFLDQGTDS